MNLFPQVQKTKKYIKYKCVFINTFQITQLSSNAAG